MQTIKLKTPTTIWFNGSWIGGITNSLKKYYAILAACCRNSVPASRSSSSLISGTFTNTKQRKQRLGLSLFYAAENSPQFFPYYRVFSRYKKSASVDKFIERISFSLDRTAQEIFLDWFQFWGMSAIELLVFCLHRRCSTKMKLQFKVIFLELVWNLQPVESSPRPYKILLIFLTSFLFAWMKITCTCFVSHENSKPFR